MALTRKMLSAMDIPAEKIDEIINAHTETVNALKDERDKAVEERDALKSKDDDVAEIQKKLDAANAELETLKKADWESKYTTLKSEYDGFKKDTEAKATKAVKESAYKKLLEEAGVSAKRIDSVMKVSGTAIDGIKFDKDGKVEEADKLIESVKTEWADFIQTTGKKGADVSNPPEGNGGGAEQPSRAKQLVAQYRNEHYGNLTKEE